MVGILILDAQTGMVTDVNPFLIELMGFTYEQFLGKAIWELGFFTDVVANEAKFAELRSKEYVRYGGLPLKTRDGQAIEVEFVSNVYLVDGEKVIQCNIRDVTECRKAEEDARQLTANIVPADRQRCFDAGMNSYLNKPVKMAALASLLIEAASDLMRP